MIDENLRAHVDSLEPKEFEEYLTDAILDPTLTNEAPEGLALYQATTEMICAIHIHALAKCILALREGGLVDVSKRLATEICAAHEAVAKHLVAGVAT